MVKKTILAFCLTILSSLNVDAAPGKKVVDQVVTSVAAAARDEVVRTEVDSRKAHCDKAYRALRRNHDTKDCVDLEEAIQRAHKLVDGADFNLSARAASVGTQDGTLAIVEKLEQIHRALADDLTEIVWSFVEKLNLAGGNFTYANATDEAGVALAAQTLNDAASWMTLLNAKLNNNAAGDDMGETEQVDRVREALISLVVLAAVGERDVGSIAGGFDRSQLHAAIAKQLWVMDSVKLMKAMSIRVHVHGYTAAARAAVPPVNIGNLDTLSQITNVRAHTHDVRGEVREVGQYNINAIAFARAKAALDKLLAP